MDKLANIKAIAIAMADLRRAFGEENCKAEHVTLVEVEKFAAWWLARVPREFPEDTTASD